jgi:4a-hydroxytetrahydrobiopterin dehydratase
MKHIQPYHIDEAKDPCWSGYKQIGTKMKGGRRVPRCVPVKETEMPVQAPAGWTERDNSLYKKFVFENFDQAFEFMRKVAEVCNRMNHHPKWTNIYKTVECWLRTHDAGDIITKKDRELALKMDEIASR